MDEEIRERFDDRRKALGFTWEQMADHIENQRGAEDPKLAAEMRKLHDEDGDKPKRESRPQGRRSPAQSKG